MEENKTELSKAKVCRCWRKRERDGSHLCHAGSWDFHILWSPGALDHVDGYGYQLSVPLAPQNRKTVLAAEYLLTAEAVTWRIAAKLIKGMSSASLLLSPRETVCF